MQTKELPFCRNLNPSFLLPNSKHLGPFSNPLRKSLNLKPRRIPKPRSVTSLFVNSDHSSFSSENSTLRRELRTYAGRSKKKGGGPSPGRFEGNAEYRRELKRSARRKSQKLAESHFYRLKNPNRNYADNFSENELQQIGLGYDRMVRFVEKDDPNLRHPYDWYKYGEFGPYSWRGVVVGEPIRGRHSDERVTIISEVKDHEEFEKIEQSEMASDFSERLQQLDKSVGLKYFWVFVRHPKWRISELPWQQWTLVSEVVLEAGKDRLDKWNLMGRLGNRTRKLITQCAAWMRPDIIYVKRPVYQCRFEPQDEFFKAIIPFLDPSTEQDFLFELEDEDGRFEMVTYFGGLCKLVRANPKAVVDDVVKAYEKLSDEKKSKCLKFLLTNHPVPLLHPYTREWKARLEEEELGCEAPEDDDYRRGDAEDKELVDWIETDDDEEEEEDDDDDDDENEQDDIVMDTDDSEDGAEPGVTEGEMNSEEDEKYWDEEFKRVVSSPEAMEELMKRSSELTSALEKQFEAIEVTDSERVTVDADGDETQLRGKRAKVKPVEWKYVGYGPWRKRVKKSKIPPELFLKAAVRPFTYRNLVKEVVLTRHAIVEGEIGPKAKR